MLNLLLKKSIKTPEETVGLSITDIPCDEIPTSPGDVVVFDARIWHAVPYVGNRRHMMSFLYVDKDYQEQAVPAGDDYRWRSVFCASSICWSRFASAS